MNREKKFWDQIVGSLAKELGLTVPSEAELEEMAKSVSAEPLSEQKIEEIVRAARRGTVSEKPTRVGVEGVSRVHPGLIPSSAIGGEMALALNRNRGAQEPGVDQKINRLRERALSDDDPKDSEKEDGHREQDD